MCYAVSDEQYGGQVNLGTVLAFPRLGVVGRAFSIAVREGGSRTTVRTPSEEPVEPGAGAGAMQRAMHGWVGECGKHQV